jgi:hypothetical protein
MISAGYEVEHGTHSIGKTVIQKDGGKLADCVADNDK